MFGKALPVKLGSTRNKSYQLMSKEKQIQWRDHVGQLDADFPELQRWSKRSHVIESFETDHGNYRLSQQEHNTNRANAQRDQDGGQQ